MNIEKIRGEFESAVKRDWPFAPLLRVNQVGAPSDRFYRDDRIQHAWWGWQASRSSLEIELPTCEYANAVSEYSKGHRQGIRACREAIQSTGAKVK